MKLFRIEVRSYEDRFQIWFAGREDATGEEFGEAVASSLLKVFGELEDTLEDSPQVRKDYPLFVLLGEESFYREMEAKGFRRLEADVSLKGDSYSVLWETPEGVRRLTPREEEGELERFLINAGVERLEEDPDRLMFG